MIAGFALNGNYKEALDLFCLMVDLDLKPNHLTFLAILQACTHAGLLEKGMEFFDMMKKVYKINPGVHHYFCLADLLGRKGRLEEATELVKSMLMKPDACIWGALFCACKIHRNVDIGEYACRHLFELEPQGAVPFVEMANIYASERRWDKVASLRTAMKFKKVKKFPGQSLLHINGRPSDCPIQGFRGYKVKTAIEEGSNFYGALVLTEDEFLDKFISRFRDDAEVLLVTYKAHLLDSTQEEDS